MSGAIEQQLIDVATAWDQAMLTNDADAIGQYMARDWVIIGPDGSTSDKAAFLDLIQSGALTHSEMTSQDFQVRVYGETAVVTARGVSAGDYQGRPFRELERASNVFVKQAGHWKCVLTHLSKLSGV